MLVAQWRGQWVVWLGAGVDLGTDMWLRDRGRQLPFDCISLCGF